tara:strand:+ start:71 stop:337 length:267 start_codon:yes stop_codon:yes gene_type:complete
VELEVLQLEATKLVLQVAAGHTAESLLTLPLFPLRLLPLDQRGFRSRQVLALLGGQRVLDLIAQRLVVLGELNRTTTKRLAAQRLVVI